MGAKHLEQRLRRVRDMVAEGQDPESAQQMIVEEHAGKTGRVGNKWKQYIRIILIFIRH